MTANQQAAARIHRSHNSTDTARNEKQKSFLLEHIAKQLTHATTELCEETHRLVAESKRLCAQSQKLTERTDARGDRGVDSAAA